MVHSSPSLSARATSATGGRATTRTAIVSGTMRRADAAATHDFFESSATGCSRSRKRSGRPIQASVSSSVSARRASGTPSRTTRFTAKRGCARRTTRPERAHVAAARTASVGRTSRRPGRRRLVLPTLAVLAAATFALSGLVVLRAHPRFAVNRVVMDGVPEARRAETEELTDAWIGRPLLFLDLEQPVAELSKKSWVAHASTRRIVPDTIAVRVVARPPVALVARADKDG